MKSIAYLIFFLIVTLSCEAQRIIFSDNFENNELNSAWQVVSGKWHIADVQEIRIAPAENGYQYVLRSDSPGIIRLLVDLPDTVRPRQIKFKFAYYTYAQGAGAAVQIEFHKKGWKDGLRGRLSKIALPPKGRWIEVQRTFLVPVEGTQIHITFFGIAPQKKNYQGVCFDSIVLSTL